MLDLDRAIRERHSTRMFLPTPVPRDLVEEVLALAQCAPSNSNIQPWHMVASGEPRDRLVAALLDEAKRRPPNVPPLPEAFQHYRSELGREVYGSMGIAREENPCIRRSSHPTSGPFWLVDAAKLIPKWLAGWVVVPLFRAVMISPTVS